MPQFYSIIAHGTRARRPSAFAPGRSARAGSSRAELQAALRYRALEVTLQETDRQWRQRRLDSVKSAKMRALLREPQAVLPNGVSFLSVV
jgi:hypothetical protein